MISTERLAELKREDWPRLRVAHIQAHAYTTERWDRIRADADLRKLVDAYLRHYVPDDCPGCGRGYFVWGIVHGHGYCSRCGWPGRLYHRVLDSGGSEVIRFEALFWAHPYEVAVLKKGRA